MDQPAPKTSKDNIVYSDPSLRKILHLPLRSISIILIGGILIVVCAGIILYRSQPRTDQPSSSGPRNFVLSTPTPTPIPIDISKMYNLAATTSAEQKKTIYQQSVAIAQETGIIVVSKCLPQPLVLRVKQGASFTWQNRDSVPHTIRGVQNYTLPAKANVSATATFSSGPGLYSYTCDQSNTVAGMILVE